VAVDRDADHSHPCVLEDGDVVPDLAQLALAATGEREREEHEDNRRLPPCLAQGQGAAAGEGQREVGCGVSGNDRHADHPVTADGARLMSGALSLLNKRGAHPKPPPGMICQT